MSASMTGGERLQAVLKQYASNLASAGTSPEVKVGFLENATYDDGKPVASVAAINEFGGTINRDAGTVTVYRKVAASGTHFLRNGRFVKRSEANFSSTHAHGAYSVTIPPRPFFRNMIRQNAASWPKAMADQLRITKLNTRLTLERMGALISGQLRQSIVDTNTPPNAPSTIARKGSSKPLVDTGHMLNSIDYEVTDAG